MKNWSFKDSNGNDCDINNSSVTVGNSKSFKVDANLVQIDQNGNEIPVSGNISYNLTDIQGDCADFSIDNYGNITVSGTNAGNAQASIQILFEGIVIKVITFKVQVKWNSSINWNVDSEMNIYAHETGCIAARGLSGSDNEFKSDLPNYVLDDTAAVTSKITQVYNALVAKNDSLNLDLDALETAYQQMIVLYTQAMHHVYGQISNQGRLKRGKGQFFDVTFNGTNYRVAGAQDDDGHEFNGSLRAENQSANSNDLGIYLQVKTDRKSCELWFNTGVMCGIFEKLYKAALGV